MKILLISGFLGAGKTSFIKALAKNTGREFVIIENEFGDLGVDGEILKQQNRDSDANFEIWELSEGCICCSINLDFTHSLLTIANSLDPDYLIVEPSGVALPSNIISKVKKICYERIELLPPLTILDGQHYQNSKREFSDYFDDQIKTASRIIVSKSEDFSAADFSEIKNNLCLKADVDFMTQHYSKWDKDVWFELLGSSENKEYMKREYGIVDVDDEQQLENISIQNINIASPTALIRILNIMLSGVLGNIIRAKGYFESANGRFLSFDLVDTVYSIKECEQMPDNRVVVIGHNLNKISLNLLFADKSLKRKLNQ